MHLSREEVEARFNYDETCHHLDGFVCARCAGGIKWFPRITVEKYSPDQTAYAEKKLAELASMGRRPWLSRFGLDRLRRPALVPVNRVEGDWLRELFPSGPEDGYAYDSGNSLVNAGLNNVTYLLTTGATGAANGSGHNTLGTNATSIVGVGTGTTAWTASDTALTTDNTANAYYQSQDANFPTTSANGTINGQSTFGTSVANFSWNEWCWATGSSTITAGSHLSAVCGGSTVAMLNHKIPASSLGSKASGASWVFTQTITFS